MKISRRNLIGSGIAATTPGALTAHAKESKDSNEINFDKRAAIPEYRINSLGQVIMNPNQVISNVFYYMIGTLLLNHPRNTK